MNPSLKHALITEAQRRLVDNPQDSAHDITHHYRVWLLAKEIAKSISENADLDLVEVLCWWHDVQIKAPEDGKRVAETTAAYVADKFEGDLQEKVFDSIKNHKYGLHPHYLEGKVLQDADKLEILSLERLRIVQEGIRRGEFTEEDAERMKKMIARWLPEMPGRYHFDVSKQMHDARVGEFESVFQELRV